MKKISKNKIVDLRNLEGKLKTYRQKKKKIVLTMGTWDLLHIGHARYMQQAKKHGDILVVGVDSDEKVKTRKGPDRPVVPQEERMEMICHLGCTDFIVLKELNAPKWHMIKMVRPDVLIATKETYDKKQLSDVRKLCKKVVVLDPQATTSTSAKIRRLQITTANKIEQSLRPKLVATIEEVLAEIKGK